MNRLISVVLDEFRRCHRPFSVRRILSQSPEARQEGNVGRESSREPSEWRWQAEARSRRKIANPKSLVQSPEAAPLRRSASYGLDAELSGLARGLAAYFALLRIMPDDTITLVPEIEAEATHPAVAASSCHFLAALSTFRTAGFLRIV